MSQGAARMLSVILTSFSSPNTLEMLNARRFSSSAQTRMLAFPSSKYRPAETPPTRIFYKYTAVAPKI